MTNAELIGLLRRARESVVGRCDGLLRDQIDAALDQHDLSTVVPVYPCPVCFIPHATLIVNSWCDSCREALPDDPNFRWWKLKHVEWGARRARWGQRKLAELAKKGDAK
jgi:hypothetical protein